jgi:hypothetical protein
MTNKRKIIKLAIIAVLFIINLILLAMFGSMTPTFTSIKAIYADTGEEIEGVKIASDGELVATTDSSGNALIQSSKLGTEITLASDDIYTSTIAISDLNQEEPIKLLKKGVNYVYGTLESNADLSSVNIKFDGEDFKSDADGNFIISSKTTGDIEIEFISDNFEHKKGNLSIKEGINVIAENISIDVAGSLFFKNRSYIEEEPVNGVYVEAENVNSESITYSESETKILGLTPDKEYFVRIKAQNVNDREYIVKANNSATPFGDVRLVETGYYPLILDQDNRQKLLLADYDGKIRTTVIDESRIEFKDVIINNTSGVLSYRTNENTERNAFPVNHYNLLTGTKSIITNTNVKALSGDLHINYDKAIIVTNTKVDSIDTLKLYNLKGEYIRDLYKAPSTRSGIDNVIISPDGETVFIEVEINNEQVAIISDVSTSVLTEVESGDLSILAIDNNSSNFVYRIDNFIHSYNYPNRQDTELAIREIGENFMFDNTDNGILYFTLNDNKIVKYRYDTNFVEEVVVFDKLNQFNSITQEREYIFTIKDQKINILSKNAPTKFKNLSGN